MHGVGWGGGLEIKGHWRQGRVLGIFVPKKELRKLKDTSKKL